MRNRAALLASILVCLAPSMASAAEPSPAALFEDGRKAFDARRWEESAAAFERSAEISPHVAALANAAEAWERAGKLARAARACDRALSLALPARERTALERRLERLLTSVATLELRGKEGRSIKIDDFAATKPPATLRLTPGTYAAEVLSPNGEVLSTRAVELAAGQAWVLDLDAVTVAKPPPGPAPVEAPKAPLPAPRDGKTPGAAGVPWASWGAFAVAGGALATSATFGVLTVGAKEDFEGARTAENRDAFYRDRLVTNVALGVAGIAALIGVAVLILDRPAPDKSAKRLLQFNASAGGLRVDLH